MASTTSLVADSLPPATNKRMGGAPIDAVVIARLAGCRRNSSHNGQLHLLPSWWWWLIFFLLLFPHKSSQVLTSPHKSSHDCERRDFWYLRSFFFCWKYLKKNNEHNQQLHVVGVQHIGCTTHLCHMTQIQQNENCC